MKEYISIKNERCDSEQEVYKWIKGYEELYMVSNKGNVKSFKRKKPKVLRATIKLGYCSVHLIKDKKEKLFYIHRLVAETFLDNVNNLPFVNHINEIKSDNRVENLEWVSVSENARHGTSSKRTADKLCKAIIQYDLDGNCINTFKSIKDAEKCMGVSAGSIGNVCRGVQKTACGFKWEFVDESKNKCTIEIKELIQLLRYLGDYEKVDINTPIKDIILLIEYKNKL